MGFSASFDCGSRGFRAFALLFCQSPGVDCKSSVISTFGLLGQSPSVDCKSSVISTFALLGQSPSVDCESSVISAFVLLLGQSPGVD